jgi:hypothetical protein
MTRYVEIPTTTKVVATVDHRGRQHRPTGKYGTRLQDGATVFEFGYKTEGCDFRLWAKADGSEIEED